MLRTLSMWVSCAVHFFAGAVSHVQFGCQLSDRERERVRESEREREGEGERAVCFASFFIAEYVFFV